MRQRSGTALQLSPIARKQRALAGLGYLGAGAPTIPIGQGAGKGAESGAISGASLGTTIMPGIGTAIGAVVGAVAGAIAGAIGKQDPEIQNFNQAIALWQQQPDAVYNLANKYLVLAGLFDLTQQQAGKIRIYRKYGRMGEEPFTRDMVAQVYQAAQSGAITPQDSAVSVYQKVILPWEDSWGFGPEPSNPHSDFVDRLLTGLIFDYVTGYGPKNWFSRSGPLPASFSSIPPFQFPTVAAAPTTPPVSATSGVASQVPPFPGWSTSLPSDARLTVPWTETENGYTTTFNPVAGGNNQYTAQYPGSTDQFQWAILGNQALGLRKSAAGWGKYTGTIASDGVTVSGTVTWYDAGHPTGWVFPFNAVISAARAQVSSAASAPTLVQPATPATVLTADGSTVAAPGTALKNPSGQLLYLGAQTIGDPNNVHGYPVWVNGTQNGYLFGMLLAGGQVYGQNDTNWFQWSGSGWNVLPGPPQFGSSAPSTSTVTGVSTTPVTPPPVANAPTTTAVSVPAGFTLVGTANSLQAYLGPDGLYYSWSGTAMSPLTGTLVGLNGTSASVISGQVQTASAPATTQTTQPIYSTPPDYSSYQPPVAAPQSITVTAPSPSSSNIPTWAYLGVGAVAVYLLMGQRRRA